jgi:DNA-binding NarL/FixJ family response regulator
MQRLRRAESGVVAVALVAAYPSVRAGLRALLAGEDRIEVDGIWGTADDLSGLDVAAGLVLLGPAEGETGMVEAFGERPWAYLLKDASGPELARAIEAVASGLVVIQPPLSRRLLDPSARPVAPGVFSRSEPGSEALTAREHEVLQLVAEGLPNKLIAIKLGISEHTVKFHITSILSKLDASSRTEAVRLGARRGLVVL